MSRLRASALAAALIVAGYAGTAAAEPAPPGCRWQSAAGGQILACKDKQGYWRRQGDDEIVGYDPPKPKPRPKPAAPPPPPPVVEGAALAPLPPAPPEMPNVVRDDDAGVTPDAAAMTSAQASPAPPEPPTEPTPPMSPLEAFFHWLLQLWRGFVAWLGSLF